MVSQLHPRTANTFATRFLISSIIISYLSLYCSALKINEVHDGPRPSLKEPPRESRQFGLFEWLFGPPVNNNSKNHDNSTKNNPHNSSSSQNKSHVPHDLRRKTSTISPKYNETYDNLNRSRSDTPYQPQNNTSSISTSSNSFSADFLPYGPIVPKPRKKRSNTPANLRQIQITDIQHAIGSELDESDINSDPSQVNLEEELKAVDRLERNLTQNPFRMKRESSSKFRQLQIPYGHDGHGGASYNNRINTLSKRQLLLSPAEQHMFALQQQQELAAATMLQQHQLLNYNRNRHSNRYIDDYYDDDDDTYDDDDSDEYFQDFSRLGMRNPLAEAMSRGIIIPPSIPSHHPGLGRRSLPEQDDVEVEEDSSETGFNPKQADGSGNINGRRSLVKDGGKKASSTSVLLGPISKEGRWSTIEDYDLSSDFNKIQARRGSPSKNGAFLGESYKEVDEDEEDGIEKGERDDGVGGKARSSLAVGRQDVTTTSEEASTDSNTEPQPSESSTEVPVTSTSENPEPTTDSGESETVTMGAVDTTSPASSTTTTTTSSQTSQTTLQPSTTKKPKPSTTKKPPKRPPYHQTLNCQCGMQSAMGHDIGDGTIVRTMVNPWLVAIRIKQKHLCSGSIINNKYILTSKSCVEGMKGLIVTAGMGSGTAKNFTVVHVKKNQYRDIALLKIKPAISPNHAMRPICLPINQTANSRARLNPDTGILVTFKKTSPKIHSSLQLVQTEVPILSSSKCSGTAGGKASESICPGPPGTMKCGGDSGGLLQVYQQGYSYEQIAVVSSTVGCRANKTPGIYTDIRKSVNWILYNTNDARYCKKPKVNLSSRFEVGSVEDAAEEESAEESDDFEEEEWGRGFMK